MTATPTKTQDLAVDELQRIMTPPPIQRQRAYWWAEAEPAVCPDAPRKARRKSEYDPPPDKIRALNFDYLEQLYA